MKERVKAFFQNEGVKDFTKKVFNKKTISIVIGVLVMVAILKIAFSLMFEVEGVVKKIDGNKITVTTFIKNRTVNVGDYPIADIGIQVGDRIKIMKNLSGEVYSIRLDNHNRGYNYGMFNKGRDFMMRGDYNQRNGSYGFGSGRGGMMRGR